MALTALSLVTLADAPQIGLRFGLGDYDQVWNNTDANHGKMHCVPTTYLNITRFLYSKGFNQLVAWAPDETDHQEIEERMFILGDEDHLDTDPESGTDAESAFYYMSDFISDRSGDAVMLHFFHGPDFSWGKTTIANLFSAGSVMAVGFGRYYRSDNPFGGGSIWTRDGGHYMGLAGYNFYNDPNELYTRNPSSQKEGFEGDISQSPWDTDVKPIADVSTRTFGGTFTHARYGSYNSDKRLLIDKMHTIMPAYGGSTDFLPPSSKLSRDPRRPGPGSVKIVVPYRFDPDEAPAEYYFTPREEMVDWVFDHGEMAVYYVTHLGRIFRVDLFSDQHKLQHVIKGTRALLVGGSTADLYAIGEKTEGSRLEPFLARLDRDSNAIKKVNLPFRALALEHDPVSGGPAVLADTLNFMLTFDDELAAAAHVSLPPVPSGSGKVIFKIDGKGNVFLTRSGANSVRQLGRAPDPRSGDTGGVRDMTFSLSNGIRSLIPVDKNTLLVQDGPILQTYDMFGAVKQSQFSGLYAGGVFKMARTHFAAKKGSLRGFAWRNLTPEEVAEALQ